MKTRDSVLGTAITRELRTSSSKGSCPALEDIAALVDGAIKGEERDNLLGHLAGCEKCLQIYIAASELTKSGASSGKRWRLISSALAAAAAVVIITVNLTLRQAPPESAQVAKKIVPVVQPVVSENKKNSDIRSSGIRVLSQERPPVARKREVLPTAERVARMLFQESAPQQLVALINTRDKTYGFAAKSDGASQAFSIGINSIDLEIALFAEDRDRARFFAIRLESQLQALAGDDGAAILEQLVERLEHVDKSGSLVGGSRTIESRIPSDKRVYVRLGAWTEGARLAAKTGNRHYFAGGALPYFRKNFSGRTQREAAAILWELELKVKEPESIDFNSVEKDLDTLMKIF